MPGSDDQFDRRSVLKILGATAVAGAGLGVASGLGAARTRKDAHARAYADERRLRTVFAQHGEGLRQTLVDEGVLPRDFDFGSVSFDVDDDVRSLEPVGEDRHASVTAHDVRGTRTAILALSKRTDSHDVTLYVQPERDEAYAVVEPQDSDERFVATEDAVTTADCDFDVCTNSCCDSYSATEEHWDCQEEAGGCGNCYVTDLGCNCSC